MTAVSMAGRPSVTNSVIPKTSVDYVSYSTYDSLGDIPKNLPKALSYIESKLPPSLDSMASEYSSGSTAFPPGESQRQRGIAGRVR